MTPSQKSLTILNTQKDQMAEHIEDLQQRFAELNKRIQLVRSFL
jgi:prefoldin subunit 5